MQCSNGINIFLTAHTYDTLQQWGPEIWCEGCYAKFHYHLCRHGCGTAKWKILYNLGRNLSDLCLLSILMKFSEFCGRDVMELAEIHFRRIRILYFKFVRFGCRFSSSSSSMGDGRASLPTSLMYT